MSADNYWAVVPHGEKFAVCMGFESNDEWPTAKPKSPLFDTAAEAIDEAHRIDEIDWSEYGVRVHPSIRLRSKQSLPVLVAIDRARGAIARGEVASVTFEHDSKLIQEFNGDNMWRDQTGVTWVRLEESIRMQASAWDLCVSTFKTKFFDGPTKDMVLGWLENPYKTTDQHHGDAS